MAASSSTDSYWTRVARRWDSLHIERQGNYSVERLFTFQHYARRTSPTRAALVLLLAPLPCLAAVVAADLIPLQSPALGLAHSHTFWLRALFIVWCTSFTIMDQYRHFIVQLPTSSMHLAIVSLFITAGAVTTAFGLACWIGYPLPFFLVVSTPSWLVTMALGVLGVWGRCITGDRALQRQFATYTLVVMFQVTITCVYPAYTYIFKRLSAIPQGAFALLLPVMKLSAKKVMNNLLQGAEDSKPQLIIFNAEIFHALFVACCMQNASSYTTTIVLIAMDFVHAVLSFHKVNEVISEFNASILENMNEENAAVWHQLNLVEAAIYLLENDLTISSDPSIRLQSNETRHGATRIIPTSLASQMTAVVDSMRKKSALKGRDVTTVPEKKKVRPNQSQTLPQHNQVHPSPPSLTGETAKEVVVSHPSHQLRNSSKSSQIQPSKPEVVDNLASRHLSIEEQRVVLSLDGTQRLRFVQHVLRLLYWTEFLLLIEFTEVIIPVVYSAYLVIAFQLPNRVYYAQLRDLDAEKLQKNVANVLLYATLELVSLVAMALLLHYKLRFSAVRQLTFVLESQWQPVQSKLVLWVAFVLQAALDHFGVDYSFDFAWLHHQPT